ncbi:MAG: hypothetical protein ACRD4F_09120 [Candidatus Angelobacter sp.]
MRGAVAGAEFGGGERVGGASSVVGDSASWWEWWSSAVVSESDQWSSARCPSRQAEQSGELQSEQR